ncbi:hypothetical protein E0504_10700 [Parafrankia sp. BMG5.11]|nr:hypothetical protein E0504_10700 [Parafrankia sp. BMG5.11]
MRSFADVTGIWPLRSATNLSIIAEAAQVELKNKPLNAPSFFALGVAAQESGEPARARAMMVRSLALDPRLRAPRLWLLSDAVRTRRVKDAARHARILAELSPDVVPAVSTILVDLMQDQLARKQLGEHLKNQPLVLAAAAQAAKAGLSGEDILELLAPSDLARLPNGIATAQSLVAKSFVRAEQFVQARRAWYLLGGQSPTRAVFDGDFQGLAGAPPFGWTFRNDANVESTLQKGDSGLGALKVTSFGSLPVVAAEQTLVLSPGNHVLTFEASAHGEGKRADVFAWRITCSSGQLLIELPAKGTGSAWAVAQSSFAVPSSSCDTQVLRLMKLRTPNDQERSLMVKRIEVSP